MFTRRTATVIISAPDASCDWTITAGDEYFPVPTISRDEKVLSAIRNASIPIPNPQSLIPTASNKVHNLNRVALLDHGAIERVSLEHDEIVLHGDATRVDVQVREQLGHRERPHNLEPVAIQGDR